MLFEAYTYLTTHGLMQDFLNYLEISKLVFFCYCIDLALRSRIP